MCVCERCLSMYPEEPPSFATILPSSLSHPDFQNKHIEAERHSAAHSTAVSGRSRQWFSTALQLPCCMLNAKRFIVNVEKKDQKDFSMTTVAGNRTGASQLTSQHLLTNFKILQASLALSGNAEGH